ncbi:sensor histidine kinase [Chondromyces crocatus]|uniref:histidine kinase n=1 Tax=Chondromyces crocatus TaxID=52 RepID=A0A0K1ELD8_CHOCO|nr:HAMP domain-containing sensor histidine kinase [Chondromyces crocatus]AKT41428.1 two-component system sensor protein [Chondromyces crocatus]
MNILDDEFFARVGHDLRGELATMLAGVDFLLRYGKSIEPSHRDMLDRVRGAGDRLKRLLDELNHAVWLYEDPNRQMVVEPCDPVVLVQKTAAELYEVAAAREARLIVDNELREGEVTLAADLDLLQVALEYVAGLALVRSRGRTVRMRLAWGDDRRPTVTISDEAGAVSPETLHRMFEPFVERSAVVLQTSSTGAGALPPRRRERLGLGLGIARGILSAHRGSLTVAAAGEGDTMGLRFTCVLGSAPQPLGVKESQDPSVKDRGGSL